MTDETVMRQYVSENTIDHRCDWPRGQNRGRWDCPVCRQTWHVSFGGAGSDTQGQNQIGKVVAFAMAYPDGTKQTFHIEYRSVITEDGVRVYEGSRVFDYYNGHWGVIENIDEDGWFEHARDNGIFCSLNGERVAVVVPSTNPFYDKYLEGK